VKKGMENYVFVVDTSGSMRCHEKRLKEYVKAALDATMWGLGSEQIALVSFNRIVSIQSNYTADVTHLKNLIDGLSFGGGTAMHDAILTSLVFEYEKPDVVIVFSDTADYDSQITEDVWSDLMESLSMDPPIIVLPTDDTYGGDCPFYQYYTLHPMTPIMILANAKKIVKRTNAKLIQNTQEFIKIKPVKTELLEKVLKQFR
jgi:hypothetical protein